MNFIGGKHRNPKLCMVVFSYFPGDVRVRREAEALVEKEVSVHVICLRGCDEKKHEIVNGVSVYRISLDQKRAGIFRYLVEYGFFIAASSVLLSLLHKSEHYQLIHVHNMPDILVLCATVPRLTGSKILLDLHDPMPELFMSKYDRNSSSPMIRMLKFLEKLSISFADLVITPNISFRDLFISRGCSPEKIHIVMNSPQENIFQNRSAEKSYLQKIEGKKFVLMYHGLIVNRHGLDIAIDAISLVKNKIKGLEFHIYGDGDESFLDRIKSQVKELRLVDIVKFYGSVPLEKIADAVSSMDCGIVPNRMDPFTNLNLPTRIFECLSVGKPVIVPRTQGIQDYFDETSMLFFEAGNTANLAMKILEVYEDKQLIKSKVEKGSRVYRRYRWQLQKHTLVNLVERLCKDGDAAPEAIDEVCKL